MKVAILMPMATQRGGGELMLWQLLEHTQDADIDWLVIFFEEGPLVSEFQNLGVETQIVPTGRLRHIHRYVRSVKEIASIVRSEDVDLVFSWSGKPHLYGSIAAKLTGVPSAWYQLGCPVGRHLTWMDRLATLLPTRCVVTLSEFGSKGQEELWPFRPTRLVYPSVNLDKFDPQSLPSPPQARKKLGLPSDGPIVGIVGRLQRWKGIHVFIKALRLLLESHPHVHGVVVGGQHALEPDYPDMLHDLISELDLSAHVTLTGFQQNVSEWMQAMDVVIHASDHEPFGIVVIEAMALGKPVVAGAEGGPREIITEETNGLLAPYGDEEALTRQVARYLDHPDFTRKIKQGARERAQEFSAQRFARRLLKSLRSVTAPSPAAHS